MLFTMTMNEELIFYYVIYTILTPRPRAEYNIIIIIHSACVSLSIINVNYKFCISVTARCFVIHVVEIDKKIRCMREN